MNPIDTACRHVDRKPGGTEADIVACAAQGGEFCMWLDSSGDRHPNEMFHPERTEDAAAFDVASADNPTVEEFDAAVSRRLY